MTLRLMPARDTVQFILRPVAGFDRSRVCRIWCDSSYSAFTPRSGAAPACEALPWTLSATEAMPAVASAILSDSTREPSNESVASCSAPRRVRSERDPGEDSSSSALTSTVSVTFKGKGAKRILLIAHMDTVYPGGLLAKQPFRDEQDALRAFA